LTCRRCESSRGLAGHVRLLANASALTQAWPERPIRLLVGYSAGGGVDAIARMLSSRLPELLGQQAIVENRAGAAGMIAADAVSKAAPDGYTLVLGESGLLIGKHLNPKMPFDPLTSFSPVSSVFQLPPLGFARSMVD
jgi:tripartite-type tricarboxylate transporter receptor subunit TctC